MKIKPVHEVDVSRLGECEFTASKSGVPAKYFLISDSLLNLKKEIKAHRWQSAIISCEHGKFSYGQAIVDEYPYIPRYQYGND